MTKLGTEGARGMLTAVFAVGKALLVVVPAAAVLATIPMVFNLPPVLNFVPFQSGKPLWNLMVVMYLIGLLSAPGYVLAVFSQGPARRATGIKARWITVSLVGGTAASLTGTAFGVMFLPVGVLCAGTLVCCAFLLWRHLRGFHTRSGSFMSDSMKNRGT